MTVEQVPGTRRWGVRFWLFNALVVLAAAFMVYSWLSPWWGARISDLAGSDHIVMRPWGVDMVSEVRTFADRSLYAMPSFFTPLMWAYLSACMLLLAVSLFVERRVSLGRFRLSLPQLLIGFVGFSYVIAVVTAFIVAQIKAGAGGVDFVGTSLVFNPMTGSNTRIVGALKTGYWMAAAAGPILIALALLRNVVIGRARK